MASPKTPRAWFVGFSKLLERVHADRPELPALSTGRSSSVLQVATAIAMAEGALSASALQTRWRALKIDHPDLEPDFMKAGPTPAPAEPPPPPTLGERVEIGRHRRSATEAKAALKEADARIAELEDRVKDLEWAHGVELNPPEWTRKIPTGRPAEHMPLFFVSDLQIGEVIRAEETEHAYGYDVATFRRRFRRYFDDAIDICLRHESAWSYPGAIYLRGGDTISGAIHDDLAETDEATPIESVQLAAEEEIAAIRHLADAFGAVRVLTTPGGNHDRDTKKPRAKRAAGHSYDSLVTVMLRRHFAGDARVSFQVSQSPDVYFKVYETPLLLTHGDKIGSRGGMGHVGPAATISRGAQKVVQEQLELGRFVKRVIMGHFHTPLILERAIVNGSFPGYSEFAKLNRMAPSPPQQWLMFAHPRHGLVDYRPVYLEPAPKS